VSSASFGGRRRLAESRRRAEGLAAALEAADLYRELADGNRDAYLPNLAAAVDNLSRRLGVGPTGWPPCEAVDLYRELLDGVPDKYDGAPNRAAELLLALEDRA